MSEYRGDFTATIGVARRDITPPAGIYARSWGAAEHDQATGVHRPLTLTALAIQSESARQALVTFDLGWWRDLPDQEYLRGLVKGRAHLADAELLIHMVHTHAGPSLCTGDADKPGGGLIAPYLRDVAEAAAEAVEAAFADAQPGCLSWAYGKCTIGQNRDLFHDGRYLVGWNPAGEADDTVLVGRVTWDDGTLGATIVNYACHPTTLGWGNTLISPDYVGALREVVEEWTGNGAPCLFLQGASGDIGAAEQYASDVAVADRTGRAIGYAAVSALEAMPAPHHRLKFDGLVESGAPLAVWRQKAVDPVSGSRADVVTVPAPRRPPTDRPTLERRWAHLPDTARAERVSRALYLENSVGTDPIINYPVWVWGLGDAVLVAHPGEAYSWLQRELRERLAPRPVVVMNLTNGPGWFYLPPEEAYDADWYQVWQTRIGSGALEQVAAAVSDHVAGLTA